MNIACIRNNASIICGTETFFCGNFGFKMAKLVEVKDEEKIKKNDNDFTKNANLIEDGLWLGCEDAGLCDIKLLMKYNIKSILVCGFGLQMIHKPQSINYLRLKCIDVPAYDIVKKDLKKGIKFINDNLNLEQNKHVLVHCAQGKSRYLLVFYLFVYKYI